MDNITNLREGDALRILSQLIRIRTMLPRGDEMDMIKYILSLLPKEKFEINIIENGANRASMVATLPGKNRKNKIAFVGHMDTFPTFNEDLWQHPPFAADYTGGSVFGRGASNMKGGITAMLMAVMAFTENYVEPPCDLILCLTADGDNAALTGAKSIVKSGYLAGTTQLIFGESTGNKIGIAQRGGVWLRIKVTGKACYACTPKVGTDALANFIELHRRINGYIHHGEYRHQYLGEPLCVITQLNGGISMNVVPPFAEGTFDIRLLPAQDNDEVIQYAFDSASDMMDKNKSLKIEIDVENSNPTVAMPQDAHIIKRFENIISSIGDVPEKTGLYYYTDACAIVPNLGVPFIFMGPGENIYNILTDESVEIKSVLKSAQVYLRYILEENW